MRRKICRATLLFSCGLLLQAAAAQSPATKSGGEAAKKDPLAAFRWLDAAGDSQSLILAGRQLSSLGADIRKQGLTDVESEVSRTGPNSMRTTRRVYDRSTGGERVLVEVVVEDVRTSGADAFNATRTTSRRDVNGNMQVAMKLVQDTSPAGSATYRTRITVSGPGPNGPLSPSQEIVQVERKTAEGVVEIERSLQLPRADGGWTTADRRLSTTRVQNGQVLTEESTYRRDANGNLILNQKELSRESTDPQGRVVQEREISLPNASGRLELDQRLTLVRQTYADGSQQTTQNRFQRSGADPSAGLKMVEAIVQSDSPANSTAKERVTAVQTPDANGKLQTVAYTKSIQQK